METIQRIPVQKAIIAASEGTFINVTESLNFTKSTKENTLAKAAGPVLGDYVPKSKLSAWIEKCRESHEHLQVKTSQARSIVKTMQDFNLDKKEVNNLSSEYLIS